MSLRVLLADESASIRKVFQMGLQDFGAEVKSVHNGLDVIEVAQSYKPDIIFADILLQKKNGYEVSQEIATHQQLSHVPVVLMWSSFMELDPSKYQSSGAQGELEKPFDVESMRALIQSLVQTATAPPISDFLSFPGSLSAEFSEDKNNSLALPPTPTLEEAPPPSTEAPTLELATDNEAVDTEKPEENSVFNRQAEGLGEASLDLDEEPSTPPEVILPPDSGFNADDMWEVKPIHEQNPTPETTAKESEQDPENFQSMELGQGQKLELDDFLYQPEGLATPSTIETPNEKTRTQLSPQSSLEPEPDPEPREHRISIEEAEVIIRSETRSILERTIKDQLPQILEKVVRQELESLLEQEMSLKKTPPSP